MRGFKFHFLTVIILFLAFQSQAQTNLRGKVSNAADSTAVGGASVYFDGTSIGVSTSEDGRFLIKTENITHSTLIITALGYKPYLISDYAGKEQLSPIYLEENREELKEVHLETDPWSREKKLGIFRREFLGNTVEALKCKIKNEDAIRLKYIPSKDILIAFAEEPLVIINRHLGYKISYDLLEFRVEFSTGTSGLKFSQLVYYEGFSFFEDLQKKTGKKILRNREKTYRGSQLHFMRSLASKKLHENEFRIFHEKFEVPPYRFFEIKKAEGLTEVDVLKDQVVILFEKLDQSSLFSEGKFFIDHFGNYSPPNNISFSGVMGTYRMAQLLPLNYKL